MAGKRKSLTKAQLIQRLRQLERALTQEKNRRSLDHDMLVYQEEARAQHEQLIEAQKALEESRDRFLDLYDSAPVAFATLDRNGVIEEINRTGWTLLQLDRTFVLNRPLTIFTARADRHLFMNHMVRCRSGHTVVNTELRLRRRDETLVPVQLTTRPATRPRLGGICYLTALTDLTEQKQAAADRDRMAIQERTALASSEAKDRFLAVLSHELRTPLTPILAAVSELRAAQLPLHLMSVVEMVHRSVDVEVRLIDDLLDLTRITRNKLNLRLEAVDIHELITQTKQMFESDLNSKKIRLALDLESEGHHVRGDASRLRQVLWNLLSNAIKFTPDNGRITVRTAHRKAGGNEGALGEVEVSVIDSGVGIEPGLLPKLFRAFEQGVNPRTGLGLGLSIAKGVVELHGGSIRADSRGHGKGATFTVSLPLVEAPVEQPALTPDAAMPRYNQATGTSPNGKHLRILLVEDHLDTAKILSSLLRRQGYEVTVSHSKSDALKRAKEPLDFVISDIGLPDGSGLELRREMGKRPQLRGIALSGFGADADVQKSLEAGFDEHLTKPVDFGRLLEVIQRLVPAQAS